MLAVRCSRRLSFQAVKRLFVLRALSSRGMAGSFLSMVSASLPNKYQGIVRMDIAFFVFLFLRV